MGHVLQIRVMAVTYDPAEVQKRWPFLRSLAWADGAPSEPRAGVLEMTQALADRLGIAMLPQSAARALGPEIKAADSLRLRLEAGLADWRPAEADRLSYELEEALDGLEEKAGKL